jgi:hypothetical protein
MRPMKKSLIWVAKLVARVVFFAWFSWTFTRPFKYHPDPLGWLWVAIAFALLWPSIVTAGTNLYDNFANDMANRVEKKIGPELHAFYVQYQMDTNPPSVEDLLESDAADAYNEAMALSFRYEDHNITLSLRDILIAIKSIQR